MVAFTSTFIAWAKRRWFKRTGGRSLAVTVEQLWVKGAMICTPRELERGQKVELSFGPTICRRSTVIFGHDRCYTCVFETPIRRDDANAGYKGYAIARLIS